MGTLALVFGEHLEIRYLTPMSVDVKKKKYCRFKKFGINFIDYKDPEFRTLALVFGEHLKSRGSSDNGFSEGNEVVAAVTTFYSLKSLGVLRSLGALKLPQVGACRRLKYAEAEQLHRVDELAVNVVAELLKSFCNLEAVYRAEDCACGACLGTDGESPALR